MSECISVAITAYNEEATLISFVQRVLALPEVTS
jgi:glycosyltransferase involved in cell wall biosynthesis